MRIQGMFRLRNSGTIALAIRQSTKATDGPSTTLEVNHLFMFLPRIFDSNPSGALLGID
jgi:hypothetical protein